MSRWSTVHPYDARSSARASEPHSSIAILALAAAIPGFVIIWLMSAPLLPAAFSLALLVTAGCAALLAWLSGAERRTDHVNLWDIAGAYAFVGFASGMISRPKQVLELFGLAMPVQ
jgi:VIT1/CCC1 family predicted Fe2+/Mn2+ transporter